MLPCVLQVKDEQHQCSLGTLKLPLSQLLSRDDMTINQRFQLSNSGPNSTLKMKIALRVLSLPQETGVGGGRAAVVTFAGTAPQAGGAHGDSHGAPGKGGWESGRQLRGELTGRALCVERGRYCMLWALRGRPEAWTQTSTSGPGYSCCLGLQPTTFSSFGPESTALWINKVFCSGPIFKGHLEERI